MELADVTDSKSVDSDIVWVRPPSPAPRKPHKSGKIKADSLVKKVIRFFVANLYVFRGKMIKISVWVRGDGGTGWGTKKEYNYETDTIKCIVIFSIL